MSLLIIPKINVKAEIIISFEIRNFFRGIGYINNTVIVLSLYSLIIYLAINVAAKMINVHETVILINPITSS